MSYNKLFRFFKEVAKGLFNEEGKKDVKFGRFKRALGREVRDFVIDQYLEGIDGRTEDPLREFTPEDNICVADLHFIETLLKLDSRGSSSKSDPHDSAFVQYEQEINTLTGSDPATPEQIAAFYKNLADAPQHALRRNAESAYEVIRRMENDLRERS